MNDDYDITCIKNDVCNMAICDKLGCKHRVDNINEWITAETKPEKDKWVLGLCKLTSDVLSKEKPVMFQVRWTGKYWVDWCGDIDEDADWKVLKWISLPKGAVI